MTLPSRIRQKSNRTERWKSPAHRRWVGEHGCCVPNCGGRPIEVAHLRNGTDAGMGRKSSDWFTISLCRDHHAQQHRVGEGTFEAMHTIDMRELADEFAAKSPKAREIAAAKRELVE